jgi:hypothetical protein
MTKIAGSGSESDPDPNLDLDLLVRGIAPRISDPNPHQNVMKYCGQSGISICVARQKGTSNTEPNIIHVKANLSNQKARGT